MERRNFLKLLGGSVAATALPVEALAMASHGSRETFADATDSAGLDRIRMLLSSQDGLNEFASSVAPPLRRRLDCFGLARRIMNSFENRAIFTNIAGKRVTVPFFPVESTAVMLNFDPKRLDLFRHTLHSMTAEILVGEDGHMFNLARAVSQAGLSFKTRKVSRTDDLLAEAVRDIQADEEMRVTHIVMSPRDYAQAHQAADPAKFWEETLRRVLKTGTMGYYEGATVMQSRRVVPGAAWSFALRENQPDDRADLVLTTKTPLHVSFKMRGNDLHIKFAEEIGMTIGPENVQRLNIRRSLNSSGGTDTTEQVAPFDLIVVDGKTSRG
jgi:hypothetical protein